ncbi:MAG TPA: BadF/BadG/BcrA/BcrD ATPase family protein [Pseudolysinimonas sp.]|nr:BadF/BadG/BcrA/BcrD ATPase family protein [Pseudolysinimonas sp.]
MGVTDHGLIVGVDGGGSKTHAVALTLDGELVGRGDGPGSSPHWIGVEASIDIVDAAVRAALGGGTAAQANLYLSGLDLEAEVTAYTAALVQMPWAGPRTVVANDLWALLRAGTESPDAVAVICGTGINAVGVRADGATVRFAALGPISGDWGGGSGLGEEALWHAARDEDGRGPATLLRDAVLRGMGVSSIARLTEDLHLGRRALTELAVLSPAVFDAARQGDAVAGALVDRQAAEVVAFARAALTRLELLDREVPVVLGGGIIRAGDERLMRGISEGLAADAPHARIVIVSAPPIVGAGLLALESAGASPAALDRARAALS